MTAVFFRAGEGDGTGRTNRPNEYIPERMPKYAVAENQTCGSRIPRRTSDHLNASSSTARVLWSVR
jgi:hypothetical protein